MQQVSNGISTVQQEAIAGLKDRKTGDKRISFYLKRIESSEGGALRKGRSSRDS